MSEKGTQEVTQEDRIICGLLGSDRNNRERMQKLERELAEKEAIIRQLRAQLKEQPKNPNIDCTK